VSCLVYLCPSRSSSEHVWYRRTGQPGRIQASKATADLLCVAKKDSWVNKRPDLVNIEGKGKMEMFWINAKSVDTISTLSSAASNLASVPSEVPRARVLNWSTECLGEILKKILTQRGSSTSNGFQLQAVMEDEGERDGTEKSNDDNAEGEVAENQLEHDNAASKTEEDGFSEHEIIFARDDREVDRSEQQSSIGEACSLLATETSKVSLAPILKSQLGGYIHSLHDFFEDHEFHNLEHAFHVAMTMDRVLTSIEFELDPLAQFAGILSALISDVGHPGIPNQFIKTEGIVFGDGYKGKSFTQHLAFEIAWKLYLEPSFSEFRQALTPTEESLARFRKLILSCVNATDAMNPTLSASRKGRWQKAFGDTHSVQSSDASNSERLAITVVLEHCILASYMYHTMRQWGIYQDWNERHFNEMCTAYTQGEICRDPSQSWYLDQLTLFDNVVIPLAEQLHTFFDVDSDLLNFARRNRSSWERRGLLKVAEMKLKLQVHAR
jgi:hypothetical protein